MIKTKLRPEQAVKETRVGRSWSYYRFNFSECLTMLRKFTSNYFKNDKQLSLDIKPSQDYGLVTYCIDNLNEDLSTSIEINREGGKNILYANLYHDREAIKSHLTSTAIDHFELDDLIGEPTRIYNGAQLQNILKYFKIEINALENIADKIAEQYTQADMESNINEIADNDYWRRRLGF